VPRPPATLAPSDAVIARALVTWPRLDRRKLRRTAGDAGRIVRLVEGRTALPPEAILAILQRSHDDQHDPSR
jgi:hypothetical protein